MKLTNYRYLKKIGAAAALKYCGISVTAFWDSETCRVVWEVPNDIKCQDALIAYHERSLTGSLADFANIHHATYMEMKQLASKYERGLNGQGI